VLARIVCPLRNGVEESILLELWCVSMKVNLSWQVTLVTGAARHGANEVMEVIAESLGRAAIESSPERRLRHGRAAA
jgi:hypothetical protein